MWKKIVFTAALLGSFAFLGLVSTAQAGHCQGGYSNNYYQGGYGYNRGYGYNNGYGNVYYNSHPSHYNHYHAPYNGGYHNTYHGGFYQPRGNNFHYGSNGFSIGIYSR